MEFFIIFLCSLLNMIFGTALNLVNKWFLLNTSFLSNIISLILMIVMLISFKNLKCKNENFKKSFDLLFLVILIGILNLFFPTSHGNMQTMTPFKFFSLILSLITLLADIYFFINTSLGISDLCIKNLLYSLKSTAEKQAEIYKKTLVAFVFFLLISPVISLVSTLLLSILTILFAAFVLYIQINFLILLWNSHKLLDNN
ncbi:hypothetical protein [Clostridium ihumii]|uniref:hypothetical protein n=1 Tax=Clostridium ihumii TaxID=1470356 RepID=UPI00055106D9|nr:hypothetical protein [Clostridium ihumii]